MARIRINDLPALADLGAEQMKSICGGKFARIGGEPYGPRGGYGGGYGGGFPARPGWRESAAMSPQAAQYHVSLGMERK